METTRIIQSVTVLTPEREIAYEVGSEVNGEAIIEIRLTGAGVHVLGEDGPIVRIENCPIIVSWQSIVTHDNVLDAPKANVIND